MEGFEAVVLQAVLWLKLLVELIGVLLIAWGCLTTTAEFFDAARNRQVYTYTRLRLRLGRFLALGLEFQLAADILNTAIAPSWDQVALLAAIAAIRTFLNYFLSQELERAAAVQAKQREEKAVERQD